MGFSVPKLPLFKKTSSSKMFSSLPIPNVIPHSGFNRKPIVVKTSPNMVGTPLWAPREDNYLDVSYDMNLQDPKVIVVEYKAKPGFQHLTDFTRLYLVEKNGQPVPYMKDMWRELSRKAKDPQPFFSGGYNIDSEGRITIRGSLVKANEIWPILREAITMWGQWKDFPTINELDTVRKLIEGQKAIDKFKSEEAHSWIANQIKAAQETIKSAQEEIVKLEKSLNEIYEQAADAMNLFEDNGIKADMDGEPEKDHSFGIGASLDIASLYPGSMSGGSHYCGLRFIGPASISTNSSGGTSVGFSTNPGSIEVGDMVVDPKNNKQAVYCGNNKWELIP